MSTVTKDATGIKHITLTLETGNVYAVKFYNIGQYKPYAYIRNTGSGTILCGSTDTLVSGADDVLSVPASSLRLYVSTPVKGTIYLSGVSTCEIDFSDKILHIV